ncbi:MAG: Nucleoside-diphosphate-sugar epimerase [Candidatus Methanohalarchaeum thermophilum]|uniref:Nucleoside-diphosphate-sugar epimerase n=1 Tax=Methanohalarchaeum thermophilum TaxID=1903181 RepID=A0A1Q6DSQ5_METT1|nr:MAG: Nucleoside-diphosphate-sugar epimerase [Candidatus Methanohalarchaeum thermophilum]
MAVIDNLDPYYSKKLKKKNLAKNRKIANKTGSELDFINLDITNFKTLEKKVKKIKPDFVFHQAAQAGVRTSVKNPIKPAKTNILGTLHLLKISSEIEAKRFINASSSSVYGDINKKKFKEKAKENPVSPYAVSKLSAEKYTQIFKKLYELPTVNLRYFTVYGPRMRPNMAISNFVSRCLNNKPPEIYGNGKQTRDFTYIKDIVKANLKLLKTDQADGETINIGSGKKITINKLAQKIIKKTGYEGKPKYSEERKGDVSHTLADTTKANELIDYSPETEISEGINKFINWYKENKDWYQPLI